MTEETIFEGTQTPSEEVKAPEVNSTIPQELADWVGPGKKYQTVDEVYKAFPHAQNHIETLNNKVSELERELNERKTAEQVLEEIRSRTTEQQKPTSQGVEVNESVLSELVERKLNERVTKQQQESNLDKVVDSFTEHFKDKREEVYAALAKENGLTIKEMNQLAAKSPSLVLRLAGIDSMKPKGTLNINNDVNTQALHSNRVEDKELTSKVSPYATSKELANAWRIAGQKIQQKLQG